MERARKIIYRYSNNVWSDDLEIDLTGRVALKRGEIITRRWKNWKIDSVHFEDQIEDRGMRTIWVTLVDAPAN